MSAGARYATNGRGARDAPARPNLLPPAQPNASLSLLYLPRHIFSASLTVYSTRVINEITCYGLFELVLHRSFMKEKCFY